MTPPAHGCKGFQTAHHAHALGSLGPTTAIEELLCCSGEIMSWTEICTPIRTLGSGRVWIGCKRIQSTDDWGWTTTGWLTRRSESRWWSIRVSSYSAAEPGLCDRTLL